MTVDNLRVMGRATQGVKLIKLNDDDEISAVEKISYIEEEEGEGTNEATDEQNTDTNENE